MLSISAKAEIGAVIRHVLPLADYERELHRRDDRQEECTASGVISATSPSATAKARPGATRRCSIRPRVNQKIAKLDNIMKMASNPA
jgi:hypothetical protein